MVLIAEGITILKQVAGKRKLKRGQIMKNTDYHGKFRLKSSDLCSPTWQPLATCRY